MTRCLNIMWFTLGTMVVGGAMVEGMVVGGAVDTEAGGGALATTVEGGAEAVEVDLVDHQEDHEPLQVTTYLTSLNINVS